MKLLDGRLLSTRLHAALQRNIEQLTGRPPALAFLLVGDDPASHTYVNIKTKRCREVGIRSIKAKLPALTTEGELLARIEEWNRDETIDGILVQQPLPPSIQPDVVVEAIDPAKDVDGFHPLNLGRLLLGQTTGFIPCTPLGIATLLDEFEVDAAGRHVVIVGRSNIVGKPLAALLVQKKKGRNATVTLAHSATRNLAALCRSADILVAAAGSPHLIHKEMVKPKAVVIDVGIHRISLPGGKPRLTGDVAFDEVAPLCSAITPVPGGVGPMTIAMLLSNTWKSYAQRTHLSPS